MHAGARLHNGNIEEQWRWCKTRHGPATSQVSGSSARDSVGRRPPSAHVLDRVRAVVVHRKDDRELLPRGVLATLKGVHVRTRHNAARDGRLAVTCDTKTTFRRLRARASPADRAGVQTVLLWSDGPSRRPSSAAHLADDSARLRRPNRGRATRSPAPAIPRLQAINSLT